MAWGQKALRCIGSVAFLVVALSMLTEDNRQAVRAVHGLTLPDFVGHG